MIRQWPMALAVRASDWGGAHHLLFFKTELRAQFNLHPRRVAAHDETDHESGATASDSRRHCRLQVVGGYGTSSYCIYR